VLPLIAGATMIYWGITEITTVRAMQSWPQTDGVIASSLVVEELSTDSSPPRTVHYGAVRYTYTVDDEEFESSTISREPRQYLRDDNASAFTSLYPQGLTVTVYYNPAIPTQAVLKRSGYVAPLSYIAVGLFIVLVSIGGIAMGIRSRLSPRDTYEKEPHQSL
jgi:hypothetical protein